MRNYYTEKQQKQLLKSMTILIDTRENANSHIVNYFDKKKIKHKSKKLDFGDYSFMLPADPELEILVPKYFDHDIVVERKGSLTELSGNLTKDRERFEKELIRKKNAKFLLMVENGSWEMIQHEKYRTDYKATSFLATLNSYISRYNISVDFISKDMAGQFIYGLLWYHLREFLKDYTEAVQIERS